jgi:hypothetical protein
MKPYRTVSVKMWLMGLTMPGIFQAKLSYLGLPLRLRNKLPKLHMKLEGYRPTAADLQKLFKYGDLQIKAWIALSRDVPARISDLLNITPEQVQQGEFIIKSHKENVVGKCYISRETQLLHFHSLFIYSGFTSAQC